MVDRAYGASNHCLAFPSVYSVPLWFKSLTVNQPSNQLPVISKTASA